MRINILFLLICMTSYLFSQDVRIPADRVQIRKNLTIRNHQIDSIDNQLTSVNIINANTVPTTKAVIEYYKPVDSIVTIRRVPTVNDVIKVNHVLDWINWHTRVQPSMSVSISPSTTVYEIGTTTSIQINTNITNISNYNLTNSVVGTIGGTQYSFTGLSDNRQITFAPNNGNSEYSANSYDVRAGSNYNLGDEQGSVNSNTINIRGVYPVFYGVSNTDFFTTGNISTSLNKLVETEGNKNLLMNGSGYIYIAVPSSWSDNNLSSITDPNGFETINSFTNQIISVTSSVFGTHNYRIYKLNNLTYATSSNYSFYR